MLSFQRLAGYHVPTAKRLFLSPFFRVDDQRVIPLVALLGYRILQSNREN